MNRDLKRDFAAVRKILWEDWDPIGCGVPQDEYDSYVWPVLGILIRNEGRAALETYLRWAADENMSSHVPEEKLAAVLDSLLALDLAG